MKIRALAPTLCDTTTAQHFLFVLKTLISTLIQTVPNINSTSVGYMDFMYLWKTIELYQNCIIIKQNIENMYENKMHRCYMSVNF